MSYERNVKKWRLSKKGRDSWITYYHKVMLDAVADGWTAQEY